MNLLGRVDADEVSVVHRGANRRRTILKEQGVDTDAQVTDILSVAWESEGAMLDEIRKSGIDDEVVEKAALAGMRLLAGIAEELPPSVIEKLGRSMYSMANRPLNSDPGSGDMSGELFGGAPGYPVDRSASGATTTANVRGPAMDGSGKGAKVAMDAEEGEDSVGKLDAEEDTSTAMLKDDDFEADVNDDDDDDEVCKAMYDEEMAKADRTFSAGARRGYAKRGVAMADGSFPIPDADALRRAKLALGRAKPGKRSAVRAHINRRAKALGLPGLGDSSVKKESPVTAAMHTIAKALGMSQSARGATPEDPDEGQEPGVAIPNPDLTSRWGSDDNVNKEDEEVIPVPVLITKEDGTSSWDYSNVPPEARDYYRHTIEKAAKLEADLDAARERIAKQDEQALTERIEKSAREFSYAAPTTDVAEVLKAAAGSMTHEEYVKLETVLKTASSRVAEGALFTELGRTYGPQSSESPGDAWSQIEKAAEGIVEKAGETKISKEAAIDRFLQTREGNVLYEQAMRDGSALMPIDQWTGRTA